MLKEEVTEVEIQGNVAVDGGAREILLFGAIDDTIALQVVTSLRKMDRESKDDITLIISSGGGVEGSGWAIYDTLLLMRSKIIAHCFAECMSIAALILQGCDVRLLSPNCRFMVHNGITQYGKMSVNDINNALKEENFLTHRYHEALALKSNLTIDEVKKLCNNDTYMDANTAVGYGFADGILGETNKRKVRKYA